MAITKDQKKEIVSKIEGIVKDAKTMVFAHFKGLTVGQQTEMRRALRAQDISYTVAKKTLMRRGLDSAGFAGEMPQLDGEIALVSGSDEIAPAREMATFVKKWGEQLAFAGGVFGGKFVSKDEMVAIAAIPGMDALRGMFAQVVNSPRSRFAVALSEVAKN